MSKSGETQKFNKNWCLAVLDGIMQRNAAFLTIICVVMCFTINYTFPLHRTTPTTYPNQTQVFEIPTSHQDTIAERTKKMATNIEQVFKRFKDSTSDFGKNIYDHVSSGIKEHINFINEDDLRQYEQMVIMKKYPYLDLKELELKYSPSKNARQSVNTVNLDRSSNTISEPGQCERLVEESPNVEIINRGLSGFAIPRELTKHVSNIIENKLKTNSNNKRADIVKPPIDAMLGSLKNDIKEYVDKRNNKV